jgi:hypothetical protein
LGAAGMLNKPASPWWEFLSNGKALADEKLNSSTKWYLLQKLCKMKH